MLDADEYNKSLSAAEGLIDRRNKEVVALRKLVELQDKLLVCYRVGKNPGTIIDKLSDARKRVSMFDTDSTE